MARWREARPLTLTGTGFVADGTTVLVAGHECTSVVVSSPTSLTCTTSAGTELAADVTATTAGGTGTMGSSYSYLDPPTVTSVDPDHGPVAGGTTVLITGTGFDEVTGVSIGETDCVSFTRIDSTHVSCVIPAGTGTADVVVHVTVGDATLEGGYTYQAPSSGGGSGPVAPTTAPPTPRPAPPRVRNPVPRPAAARRQGPGRARNRRWR
jgi:hypothetical protein